jgi:transcriptional antiterminator RfaH
MDRVDSRSPHSVTGESTGEAMAADATGLRRWLVLHVKPRTEKKVMRRLSGCRGFHYLPTYVRVMKVQRRKVRRVLPLFPGYVFAHLSPEERSDVLRSNLVVRMIPDPFPRRTVSQLRQISRATRAAPTIAVSRQTFSEGERVRVMYGPLCGTVGYVKRIGARATLCINVDILGSSVEVSVSSADLEPFKE